MTAGVLVGAAFTLIVVALCAAVAAVAWVTRYDPVEPVDPDVLALLSAGGA